MLKTIIKRSFNKFFDWSATSSDITKIQKIKETAFNGFLNLTLI